jgi:hypothetical protein
MVKQCALQLPSERVGWQAAAPCLMKRVHDLAIDVKLQLAIGGITDPHGA